MALISNQGIRQESVPMSVSDVFGFHKLHTLPDRWGGREYGADYCVKCFGMYNAVGWTPALAGCFSAFLRTAIHFTTGARFEAEVSEWVDTAIIVRAVVEVSGHGWLFIVPDLAVTAWRFWPSKRAK